MIEVYIDGASAGDPGPSGAGIFIKGHGKAEEFSIPVGIMSNHEAEFTALIKALEICIERKFSVVSFRTDSQAVDRSMEKKYVKDTRYSDLLEKALQLSEDIDLFFIKWIPSKQNSVADRLARAAIQMNKGV